MTTRDTATGDLFDTPAPARARQAEPPRARHTDPSTSHAAAARAAKGVPALDAKIRAWLLAKGARGGTSEEIAAGLGIARVSASPRLKPMERAGLVQRTEERRAGASGVRSIVWRAA